MLKQYICADEKMFTISKKADNDLVASLLPPGWIVAERLQT
jgi:hypothetical protein